MKCQAYPFAAIVGQAQLKTALLLAAVDWRLGILLRGDKGSGKTTAARSLGDLLPETGRFVNLPLGVTEDRLLGGINLEQALQGQPALRAGLLAEADGGVLYVDEVNLLPDHLADALLDASATGSHRLEREGFSALQSSRFVFAGSMNPDEGSLRPQLLDRFALVIDVTAPLDPAERQAIVERRMQYDSEPTSFIASWTREQTSIREQITTARERLLSVRLPAEMLRRISEIVSNCRITSIRADLAISRASSALAALLGHDYVSDEHVQEVLPLALAHRTRRPEPPAAPPQTPLPKTKPENNGHESKSHDGSGEHRFPTAPLNVLALPWQGSDDKPGGNFGTKSQIKGPAIGSRRTAEPRELDVRPSIAEALVHTGRPQLSVEHLHEKIREPRAGSRYLFVVDSSGSHAAGERMRVVKGAAAGLIEKSLHRRDEVAVIAFRGVSAEILVEPTRDVELVRTALEYLPTGGRTPLAKALELAKRLVTDKTLLILLSDGRANVASATDNPWADALAAAAELRCRMLVVDTESTINAAGRAGQLAQTVGAHYVRLEDFENEVNLSALLAGT